MNCTQEQNLSKNVLGVSVDTEQYTAVSCCLLSHSNLRALAPDSFSWVDVGSLC